MGRFILRRLLQGAVTIFGVMLLTFLLFRVFAGDVAARYVNPKLGVKARTEWLIKHGMNNPDGSKKAMIFNDANGLRPWNGEFYDSLFFHHLKESLTFSGRSFETEESLTEIIRRQAPYSLAITVPALAIGWLLELVIACLVAYYRDTWIDRLGVFFSVLGMCVPFLAYMILAQALMFQIAPTAAWGLQHPANVYLPVLIDVLAGLGGGVRFYRTVILDETNRDYVRTAKAKGVPLPSILFKHVLKNCMLPILTSLVLSIPFLIMGNLLLERFFGIPGLGDLLITSINNRDVPIIAGLTFLTALVYTLGLLLTDILYAVFDPRIRLK